MDLSIVIPAWQESSRLPKSLNTICGFLKQQNLISTTEIILVLEECTDRDLTLKGIKKNQQVYPEANIRIILNDKRYGKGYSVKRGVRESRGKLILMSDADLSTPIEELLPLKDYLNMEKCDCIIGKRVQVLPQPFYRRFMGWVFRQMTKTLLRLPFGDTQCGFKLFTREFGKDVFSRVTIPGFGFDIEMLVYGLELNYCVKDYPVKWYNDDNSTVNPIIDSWKMFLNLLYVRKQTKKGVSEDG